MSTEPNIQALGPNAWYMAEESVAACILVEPTETLGLVRQIVTADDFALEQAKSVFMAACLLSDNKKPIDPTTILVQAKESSLPLTSEWVRQTMQAYLTTANVEYNASIIRECSIVRKSREIGAALEASFQGIRGIALSEGADPDHSVTDAYLLPVLEKWIGSGIPEGQILNINFPKCPLAECRGILEDRTVSKSVPFTDRYREIEKLPGSGARFMVEGLYREEAEEGSDFRALIDRYISAGFVRNLC